jgi:hypothetical protein
MKSENWRNDATSFGEELATESDDLLPMTVTAKKRKKSWKRKKKKSAFFYLRIGGKWIAWDR